MQAHCFRFYFLLVTVIIFGGMVAAMEDYLEKCINMKVEIAALEHLIAPEEAKVCLRYILKHANRKGSGIFEIFHTTEKQDHFVASRRRCFEYQGERVALQEKRAT